MPLLKPLKPLAFPASIFQIALLALLSIGCDTSSPSSHAAPVHLPAVNQVLYYPVVQSPTFVLDPALANDADSIRVVDTLFTGLVSLDDQLQIHPQLADYWEQSDDGLTWTFHLKPSLFFSDGKSLTSYDVAYSIDRALQPATKSPTALTFLGILKDVDQLTQGQINTLIGDSIQTPDDNTIQFVTSKPSASFLQALTYPCSYVVEKKLIDKYGNDEFTNYLSSGGGAGPFTMKRYMPQQTIELAPNPNYYGQQPELRKLVFSFYKDTYATYQAYQNSQLDFTEVNGALFPTSRLRTDFSHQPVLETVNFAMNYDTKPFDNIHLRQAFALALDKDAIVHTVTKDKMIATNHLIPQGMPGYNPNLTGPDGVSGTHGDLTKARELFWIGMQEEGWSSVSQVPLIKISYPNDSKDVENAVISIIDMWHNSFGITAVKNPLSDQDLANCITRSYRNRQGLQMWHTVWRADYPDPQDLLEPQFGSNEPANAFNYGYNQAANVSIQQRVQQLVARTTANQNAQARMVAYQALEQQLVDDVAWLPLWQRTGNYLLKPCVQGMTFNALELFPPDDWANIYISTQQPCTHS